MRVRNTSAMIGLLCAASSVMPAQAAENAAGFYLLGSKTSMAGFLPPPGTYVIDLNYYYAGEAGGQAAVGVALRNTGALLQIQADIEVDAKVYINAPIALWVAPEKVLGGNVGFGVMTVTGWKDVEVGIDAFAQLTLPNGAVISANRSFAFDEDTTDFGDPLLNAVIGWHQGNWHWTLGALVNVPIGPWDTGSISNISFHHWGIDTTGAVTWLDPKLGLEISTAAGFTFNWENPSTDYKTGTEFHVEWAVNQHLSKTFSFGLAGYHYQQISGDSGDGARLGSFKGRVTALGPVVNYTFMCGQLPIATQLEYMREFNVENRLEGEMGLLTVTVPLSAGN